MAHWLKVKLLISSDRKNFFPSHFWFVPYRGGDNFPKYDDLFTIGTFTIGRVQLEVKGVKKSNLFLKS